MLRSPIDIPCRTCDAAVGEPCRYVFSVSRRHTQMPGYHDDRKYVDFPIARGAEQALLGE